MAELKLLPLEETLGDEQLAELSVKLAEVGIEALPDGDDTIDFEEELTEDQITGFVDRLEAHEVAFDVYLPTELDDAVEFSDRAFGSVHSLLEALEEIRVELDIDEEGEDVDEDEEVDLEMLEDQLTHAYHVFKRAADACVARQLPLHVIQ